MPRVSFPGTGRSGAELVDRSREWQGRFALPPTFRGRDRAVGYLTALQAHVRAEVTRSLDSSFQCTVGEPEADFLGYRSWSVHIHRDERLMATMSLEWNEILSPDSFEVDWQTHQAPNAVRAVVSAAAALIGVLLSPALAGGTVLGALVLGLGGGTLGSLAWRHLADARMPAPLPNAEGLVEAIASYSTGVEAVA